MEQSAKSLFQNLQNADRRISTLLEELKKHQAMAEKVTATISEEGHGGGVSRSLENSVEQIVKIRAEIASAVAELTEKMAVAYQILAQITDEKEKECLKNRYVMSKTWEQVAESLGMTYQGVCKLHGRALKSADKIIKNFHQLIEVDSN